MSGTHPYDVKGFRTTVRTGGGGGGGERLRTSARFSTTKPYKCAYYDRSMTIYVTVSGKRVHSVQKLNF